MFKVGDKVVVVVEYPDFGWGGVIPGEIGIVCSIPVKGKNQLQRLYVDFPEHSEWECWEHEVSLFQEIKEEPSNRRFQPII